MTWLSGWGKRTKLTLDSFRVDEDLTDFPVLITLSSGTGKTDADVTNIFDELCVSSSDSLEDAFPGTSLDSVVWDTFLQPNATVTVSGALELNNQTGSLHSGASCFTKEYFDKVGVIKLVCKWQPHKDHYSTALSPNIKFCKPDAARETQYGSRNEQFAGVFLGLNGDTTDRTELEIRDAGTSAGSGQGTLRDSIAIAIDETLWHDLEITIDSDNQLCTVDLDGIYNFSAIINFTSWDSIGSQFVVEFNSPDYSKTNTERFKDVVLSITEYTDNTKKIMITNSESVPCYTEVERWDWVNEQAWLWAKVPTIVSGTDTELYLYYDKTQINNTHYIGDIGEAAATEVWDASFVSAYHYSAGSYDGTANEVKDSTGVNHGHIVGSATTDDSLICRGLDVYGNGGAVTESSVSISNVWTAESFFKVPYQGTGVHSLFRGGTDYFILFNHTNGLLGTYVGTWRLTSYDMRALSNGWHHVAAASDGTNTYFYVDGDYKDSVAYCVSTGYSEFGGYSAQPWGDTDEVRVSDVVRSAAWLKATYYTGMDDFVTFGAEEEEPVYYLDGYVTEDNQPVSREVKLYRRDTGALVDYDTSRLSDGYYYLTTPSSGTHFIVAFDDDVGEEFNALILDKVSIKGTV